MTLSQRRLAVAALVLVLVYIYWTAAQANISGGGVVALFVWTLIIGGVMVAVARDKEE